MAALIAPRPTASVTNVAFNAYNNGVYEVVLTLALSNVTKYFGLSKAVGFNSPVTGTVSMDMSQLTVLSTCYADSKFSFAVDVSNSPVGYLSNPQSVEIASITALSAPIGATQNPSSNGPIQELLGGGDPVRYVNPASTVAYIDPSAVDIFGTVYLSRVYAKDLSALEIASSGKVSLSPNDTHSIDVYTSQGCDSTGAVNATTSVIESVKDSMLLTTQDGAAALFLDSKTSSAELSAMADIHIAASSNIYLSAQNLIINVSSMTTSYAFAVAPTGELQLQQKVSQVNGTTDTRVVARFGVRTPTAQTASNVMAIL